MSQQKYFEVTVSTANLKGVFFRTTVPGLIESIAKQVSREIPTCIISEDWFDGVRLPCLKKLKNHDTEVYKAICSWLRQDGWQVVSETIPTYQDTLSSRIHSCTLTMPAPSDGRASSSGEARVPDVADQLEKLNRLRASGAIDEIEFKAAKRRLLGV